MLGYGEVVDESTHQKHKQRRSQMESYLTGIQKKFQEKGIETQHYIAHGPVVGALLNIVKKDDVDLIALASQGMDGSYQSMYRSVAARLLQRSDCPILVVRNNNYDIIR
jgi:nucleotide-binding universal stress UspA family protein